MRYATVILHHKFDIIVPFVSSFTGYKLFIFKEFKFQNEKPMPVLQLFPPVNPHAIAHDHDYLKVGSRRPVYGRPSDMCACAELTRVFCWYHTIR